jgi:hypothetical protein
MSGANEVRPNSSVDGAYGNNACDWTLLAAAAM